MSFYYGKHVLIYKFAVPKSEDFFRRETKENFNISILCPKTLRLKKVLV